MNKAIDPLEIYFSGLEICTPGAMVENALRIKDKKLLVGNDAFEIKGRINLLAFGKASVLMYESARKICMASDVFGVGLVITHINELNLDVDSNIEEVIFSTHPLISELSVKAGRKAKEFVEAHNCNDILLCLVSGGGSAMVALPIDGLSIQEKIKFISKVMHMGVPEREVNELKKALSNVKGGKLAEVAGDGRIINLVLSDERNHQLAAISSGMTVCNELIDSVGVMDKYELWDVPSPHIKKKLLEFGQKREVGCGRDINNFLIGSRDDLISFIKRVAKNYNFESVTVLENLHSCSPENAVDFLIQKYVDAYNNCSIGYHLVLCTGEVQVKVDTKKLGKGGRNQHLAALMLLKSKFQFPFSFAAVATDGMDYLEGVHGAQFDNVTSEKKPDYESFLVECIAKNCTYDFHSKMDTLIKGPKTGTNMSDFFLFSFYRES